MIERECIAAIIREETDFDHPDQGNYLRAADRILAARETGTGWVFWNPDSGEEYTPNHPVESGECVDAERIRPSTPQEDFLWQAFQGEFERAHALETRLATTTGADLLEQAATWLRARAAECHAEAGNLNRNAAARHDQYTACITLDAAANEIVRALSARNLTEGGEK